ncbi:adenosylcobinamide-phosphate guanylyltransferase [Cupriavidus basilensis OR16]|uniref:Adenosylcobinamide-phosphate guanylyltransferase n=1 Tax=Cupriavidus basilensis OR16 TaxID=1127483 RepID=H1SAK3_9BURK|nr:adenosylcobinamide-phosphate guanylyltransferase [Cupriavidus basilensis OR16]
MTPANASATATEPVSASGHAPASERSSQAAAAPHAAAVPAARASSRWCWFYVDELGRLNQKLAAAADRVRLLVAGIPVSVKGAGPA